MLTILVEHNPPHNFARKSGEIAGRSSEVVKRLMDITGIPHRYQMLPWRRAFQRAQVEDNTCLFSVNETDDRKPLFQWVGPFFTGGWALFVPPDRAPDPIPPLEEILKGTISTLSGSAMAKNLKNTGAEDLLEVRSSELAARALYMGRSDYWLAGINDAMLATESLDLPSPVNVHTLRFLGLSMACSHGTRADWIDTLNEANTQIADFRADLLRNYRPPKDAFRTDLNPPASR